MTRYELWSLVLTATYDGLTFLLLLFVAYEATIRPRRSNLAFYIERRPKDTKSWSWSAALLDFVLENRGPELKNVIIKSDPDFIGWGNFDGENPKPKSTSEYFKQTIPFLGANERQQFFWCEVSANKAVLDKPFNLIIEFDNPAFFLPRRVRKTFRFDYSALYGVIRGMNTRYDVHNVAQETARIREELEKVRGIINDFVGRQAQSNEEQELSAAENGGAVMADEDMKNTMQFILEQQAQLTVKLDQLSDKVDKLADAQVRYEKRTSQLEESFRILVQLATSADERMDEFSVAQKELTESHKELTAAQRHTDERLSALINTVERYISERRNGDARP